MSSEPLFSFRKAPPRERWGFCRFRSCRYSLSVDACFMLPRGSRSRRCRDGCSLPICQCDHGAVFAPAPGNVLRFRLRHCAKSGSSRSKAASGASPRKTALAIGLVCRNQMLAASSRQPNRSLRAYAVGPNCIVAMPRSKISPLPGRLLAANLPVRSQRGFCAGAGQCLALSIAPLRQVRV